MDNRVFIFPGSDHVFQALFYEARKLSNVRVAKNLFKEQIVEKKIARIQRIPGAWRFFRQPLLRFYDKQINFIEEVVSGDILVFSNISIRCVSLSLLKKLKENGVKLILYFIDSISNVNAKDAFVYTKKMNFDLVYSFDKEDAVRYRYNHFYTMYSKLSERQEPIDLKYDACFNGSDKGRLKLLCQLKKNCPSAKFFVNMLNISDEVRDANGFQSNKSIDYTASIDYVIDSNCILDLVADPNQSGLSLRAYEAVVYNKKILTNNPSIKTFPYYRPEYMKYVENMDDVDENFIKERIMVDYEYKGEYSPVVFINDIVSRIKDKTLSLNS